MNILSVVTIRKGSKGLKNKCTRKISGKAIFEYVIDYSLELGRRLKEDIFTVVSSDSKIIRKYCLKNKIPFIFRKPSLASDAARIEDVIFDAYSKVGKKFDYISLLYGNIPTRYPQEFFKAYNFLRNNKDFDAVISMQKVGKYHPCWMFPLDKKKLLTQKYEGYRRQDLKEYMIHDGHTILFRTKHFLEFMKKRQLKQKKGLYDAFGKRIKPMLNKKVIIDIDTEKDLELAEAVISYRKKKEDLNYEIL